MEGYFLPPVSFTAEEAVVLLIGMDLVEHKFDTDYGIKAQTSRGKLEAILPESIRREASRVRTATKLLPPSESLHSGREKEYIETLRRAILTEQKVKFHYSKKTPEEDGNRQSIRSVAPYGLVLVQGLWILIAHCDLRQDLRHFRLSRMNELTILDDRFKFPIGFNLQDYTPPDDRNIRVRILAHPSIADKVKETYNFYMEAFEDHEDGLYVMFRVRQPKDLLHFVLGWGANVVVLEPESLRNLVRDEAKKMFEHY
jgi:predicted DNA-binding transcriptional regulator YafY